MELATKDNALIRGLSNAEARVKKFGSMVATVGLKMTAAGGSLLGPITKVFADSASRASDIKTMSDRYGVSAEKISSLAYAFERSGVSLDEFGSSLDGLQGKMFDLADGSDQTFRRFAQSINPQRFGLMTVDKQIETLIDRINSLADPIDRARIGSEFFGASWHKISNGAGSSVTALRALQDEAKKAGAVLTDKQAEEGQRTVRAFTASWQALKYMVLEVGTALLPSAAKFENVADAIRSAAGAAREWIERNRGIIYTVAAVGAALVAGGIALYAFGTACTVVGTAVGAVVTVLGLVGSALSLLLTPVGLVVVAIAALTAAWLTLTESGKKFAAEVGAAFQSMAEMFGTAWSGIVAAIGKGDLELAGKIAMTGLKAIWAEAVLWLTEKWVAFKNLVVDGWHEIGDMFSEAIVGWGAIITYITDGRDAAENYATGAMNNLDEMKKNRNAENQRFRQKQISDAREERDRLRNELRELSQGAQDKGKPGEGGGKDDGSMYDDQGNARKPGAPLGPPMELFQATKGTFSSSNLSGMLGVGNNVGQRQLKTQEQIRDQLQKVNKGLDKLGVVNFK